ncbi:translation initiation factor eIF2B subunit delta [Halyomorpha halys]|uniref:translation initiation factor eIF2B subunit delta n=1 Tax=Halyomorpha halys TaxID=286706 RepID=UPI0006D4CDCF|nr:translation initiation factor eIF-2B subunit delta [Halyomorpha halys]
MEGHKVKWNTNVPYEDLVKQCPFLSQRASLPLEKKFSDDIKIPEAHISKSKKKRLKKKLKAISSNNTDSIQKNLEPEVDAEEGEMALNSKGSSSGKADIKQEKGIEKSKRVNDVVDGEVSFSHPKFSGESFFLEKESKEKIKQQKKKDVKSDSGSVAKQGKSATPKIALQGNNSVQQKVGDSLFVEGPITVPPSKKSDLDISKDDTSISKAQTKSSEKTREEIVAQREAKKKSKQLKKQKEVDVSQETVVEKQSPKINNDSCASNILNIDNASLIVSSNQVSSIPDKSREVVMAEREAKKKAKLLAKQKKVDKSQDTDSEKTVVDSKQLNSESISSLHQNKSEIKNNIQTGVKNIKATDNKAESEKSKSQLRAERRALQETQRAAKEAEKKQKKGTSENKENQVINVAEKPVLIKEISREPKTSSKGKIVSQQRIKLFSHLHLGQKPSQAPLNPNIHPSVVELGIKYSSRIISGSNARCVALLNCLKEVINDYSTPAEKEFSRGLESKLGELTNYLNQYRPFAVSMTNALRHIKSHLTQLPNNVSDDEAKRKLFDVIDTFIREQIDVAGEAICESVKNKITNGDVILIYSCSSLLYRILAESHRSGREFSIIVVDGGPWFEGQEMLRRLVEAGLKCSYVQISALSFIVRQATKVFIGAHALLANGCVMSRAGSALVALAAHAYSVPVLVCCETYKFCERVQTDAFVYNELGSPDDLAKEDMRLSDWNSLTFLTPLSIVYDITPPDLVTAVVTEIAILPCTSVPVILRVKPSDLVS